MSIVPFLKPDDAQRDESDLMRKVAELVRDTGIDVKQAIQIVKGLQGSTKPKREAVRVDVTPTRARNAELSIERSVRPYQDALALLELELSRCRTSTRKRKKCNCWFDSHCSDGGTFERRVARCLNENHDNLAGVTSAINERRVSLQKWIEDGDECSMDMSPEHIQRVIEAVSHITPP